MKIPAKYTDFILLYNETFKYIERKYSRGEVDNFWLHLSKTHCKKLTELARSKGIKGMREYWNESLKDEDIDYSIELDEKSDTFTLKISSCSAIKVLKSNNAEIWPDYCDHCKILFGSAVEAGGFDCKHTDKLINDEFGTCEFVITRKK